jgi:hypothetical protein
MWLDGPDTAGKACGGGSAAFAGALDAVALGADALQVGVAVVVAREDVVGVGRGVRAADAAQRVAGEDAGAASGPVRRETASAGAARPWS